MNYKCSNPDCVSGLDAEGHHIIPLGKGGVDLYWNLICLCKRCHRGNGYHKTHDRFKTTLFTYKCSQELAHFGFTLDEQDDDFYKNFAKALKYSEQNSKYENENPVEGEGDR